MSIRLHINSPRAVIYLLEQTERSHEGTAGLHLGKEVRGRKEADGGQAAQGRTN